MSYPALEHVLPHRGPMLLLDELVALDETGATCRLSLRPDSTFVAGGRVPATLALEYMAQCVAAYAAARPRQPGGRPRVGYLVAVRELRLEIDAFDVGDTLDVHARCEWGQAQAGRFECSVERQGQAVAHAIVSVYQPEST